MKEKTLWAGLPPLVLTLALCQFSPARTQDESKGPDTHQNQGQQQQDQEKTATFVGQIVKAKNGQYALLTDKQAGKGYYLDDQEKAKQFDGQNVKVTGTLDVATFTIHVSDIQPA
jgi:hypothetical protein